MLNKLKIILSACLFVGCLNMTVAQYNFYQPLIGVDKSCEIDVNHPLVANFREDLKRATFKYSDESGGSCTGTLINRNIVTGDLGNYFITAWHCFKTGNICDGVETDYSNLNYTFTFNWQSPPNQNGLVFSENNNGRRYSFNSKIKYISHVNCVYGDFALFQIIEPIPVHFNVYYAGWQPNSFATWSPYVNISHPNGSIKKASEPGPFTIYPSTYVQKSCQLVTKVVDVLLGWIWRRRWSTESVCTYVQVPYVDSRFNFTYYNWGNTEPGSSGSGLFNGGNRLIGELSGGLGIGCEGVGLESFGKFSDAYYKASVKNVLNPQNSWSVDQTGISGRAIGCYNEIDFDKYKNDIKSFNLYPAKLYQKDNALSFSSASYVKLGGTNKVTVKTEADFTFNAADYIDLLDGFEVENGATFNANAGVSCNQGGAYRMSNPEEEANEIAKQEMMNRMASIQIPDELEFNLDNYYNTFQFNLSPNPANGNFKISSSTIDGNQNINVQIFDSFGAIKLDNSYINVIQNQEVNIDIQSLQAGLYVVKIMNQSGKMFETRLRVE